MLLKTNFCAVFSFFLLPTLLSHASDSLKIRKTEYYENDKLVRTTSFNQNGLVVSDYFFDYNTDFSNIKENYALIVKFKDGKQSNFITYRFKTIGDSIFFYNTSDIGSIQNILYDSSGKCTQANYERIYLKSDSVRMFSLAFLEENIVKSNDGFRVLYLYDSLGRRIEERHLGTSALLNTNTQTKKYRNALEQVRFTKQMKYDSTGRLKEFSNIYFDKPEKKIWTIQYSGKNSSTEKQHFSRKKLKEKTIRKAFFNSEGLEVKYEDYVISLKKSKVKEEPKLDFITENIYEDKRIVKIVYKSVSLGKKKEHKLKHYFY